MKTPDYRSKIWPPIALLFLATFARGSDPAPGEQISLDIAAHENRLANGMRILVVPRPHASTVAAGWVVRAGSADDPEDATGLSHLMEHMLFKGSRTIGSRDLGRELELLDRQDQLMRSRHQLEEALPAVATRKLDKLSIRLRNIDQDLEDVQTRLTALALLGQFSLLYSELGATDLNANTFPDFTLYYVTLPREKLEGWFWLESDRLIDPVFREFYKEIGVVHEERRLRIESTPTGILDEQLQELFWGTHPYGRDPQGKAEHLDRLLRDDAQEFFATYYRPDRISLVLVGGVDPQQAYEWARLYFERLPFRLETRGMRQTAGSVAADHTRRMEAHCECAPRIRVLYPSVPFGHPDAAALQLLAAVLNGRTGRLFRELVVEQDLAFSAYAMQTGWRHAGQFEFQAETKGSADPSSLLGAWDGQLEGLRGAGLLDPEITRARNRLLADAFRSLKSPTALMKQLLVYEGLADWRHVNRWPDQIQSVTATDLQRVASQYLRPETRTIGVYRRSIAVHGSSGRDSPSARGPGS